MLEIAKLVGGPGNSVEEDGEKETYIIPKFENCHSCGKQFNRNVLSHSSLIGRLLLAILFFQWILLN